MWFTNLLQIRLAQLIEAVNTFAIDSLQLLKILSEFSATCTQHIFDRALSVFEGIEECHRRRRPLSFILE